MTELTSALDAPLTGDRVRIDDDLGALIGGACRDCGVRTWPRRAVCYHCGSAAIEAVTLPTRGTLTTCTRVWVPVEGIQPPYDVGMVVVDSLQLFGHVRGLTEDVRLPAAAHIRVDSSQKPPYWFEMAPA